MINSLLFMEPFFLLTTAVTYSQVNSLAGHTVDPCSSGCFLCQFIDDSFDLLRIRIIAKKCYASTHRFMPVIVMSFQSGKINSVSMIIKLTSHNTKLFLQIF